MTYTAKNTAYNRDLGILDASITLLEQKNGFAYFVVDYKGTLYFAECNANIFEKQFEKSEKNSPEISELFSTLKPTKQTEFKQYPKGLQAAFNKK